MIQSMTGYGRAEGELMGARVVVEARSVNGRYLEHRIRLPRELLALEGKVAGLLREFVSRGRIEVTVSWDPATQPVKLLWNPRLAHAYLEIMRAIQKELQLPGEVTLDLLLQQKDVIINEESAVLSEDDWPLLRPALEVCFLNLQKMRAAEGSALVEDFKGRIARLSGVVSEIENLAVTVVGSYKEKLSQRLSRLLGANEAIDPARLSTEVCIFADRCDISEELTRLKSHVNQFQAILESEGAVGRKLDFLIQEMNREINTTGSKAQNAEISHLVVDMKNELERLREQVQNLE